MTNNPFLAAPKYAITHFDSAQTDNFPNEVPRDIKNVTSVLPLLTPLPQVAGGPINIMTLASTDPDYMWGVSLTDVSYIRVSNDNFTPLYRLPLPGAPTIVTSLLASVLNQPFASITAIQTALSALGLGGGSGFGLFGGVYSVVDNNNDLYVNYLGAINAINLKSSVLFPGIEVKRSIQTSTVLPSGESVAGLSMTFDGRLIVVGGRSITILNRNLTAPALAQYTFSPTETISNSVAVDEDGGIYVVTDKKMYKLVWTGTIISSNPADGAWESVYPTGDTFPTLFGSGSGATPTLMGFGNDADKLVVITDGLKRMGLIAFWRNEIPVGFTDRIAGQIQVTCGLPLTTEFIQTDQSVAVSGYGAFVVNNVSLTDDQLTGAVLVDALARGPLLDAPFGVERFEWNPVTHSWSSVWTRGDVSDVSMVPGISTGSNIVFVNGYYKAAGTGWEITGLDWLTGDTVHKRIFGNNIFGNGFYALIQYIGNGDLIMNSLIGHGRVQQNGVVYLT
ncbi:hypothetical protein RT99_11715 [Flavobacterium sp. MEB061]|uniref:hypothetical protein n=1 Tax=Flavobacterium sp. MEB061 TaxID=1587524 RepID=UPI0005B6C6E7|nr:hypothetical protein [Flavobacterium sp. MEB061]KIQ21461.1 hypothetical protein RT99_11715 [Flavobacterium sp. MEB061]